MIDLSTKKHIKIILISLLFLFGWLFSYSNSKDHRGYFNKSTLRSLSQFQGLSSSKITALLKDQKGFIWIGTDNGLNKYDGNEIRLFKEEIFGLGHSDDYKITSLHQDVKGTIWVGTRRGLYLFNELEQTFTEVLLPETQHPAIVSLCEDLEGNLWISHGKGLLRRNVESGQTDIIEFLPEAKESSLAVTMHTDRKGELWLGTWNHGIFRMNPITGQYVRFMPSGSVDKNTLSTVKITSIEENSDGSLWMAAWDLGLLKISPERDQVAVYQKDYTDPNSLNGHKIKTLKFDQKGYLWIGIEESGLDRLAPETGRFTHYFNEFITSDIYEGPSVYSILIDDQSLMWLGFRNDGIVKVPLYDPPFRNYRNKGLTDSRVFSICEMPQGLLNGVKGAVELFDPLTNEHRTFPLPNNETPISLYKFNENEVFVGTYKGSIFRLNIRSGRFEDCCNDELKAELNNLKVESFYLLPDDNLLIGTQGGLCKLDLLTKAYKWIKRGWWVNQIIEGSQDELWLMSWGNAFKYYPQTGLLTPLELDIQGDIKSSHIKSESEAYFGTDLGFYHHNFKTGKSTLFDDIFPFVHNQVNMIVEDNFSNLWMTSENGLIFYNPAKDKFRTFSKADGLPEMRYYDGIGIRLENGQIAFGGEGGNLIFDPQAIEDRENNSNLTFTKLEIPQQSSEADNVNASMDISEISHLNLKFRQNIITFHFALLSYINPEKHRYRYMLEGFNQRWFDNGNSNFITFTNLDPGNYTLKIQAANEENNWGPIKSISIHISPPIYKSWYAYLFYIAVLASIFMLIKQFYANREKLKNKLKDEHMNFEKMKAKATHASEFSQMRLKFFTNISHEFRTPLTLILGPLENFIKNKKWPSEDHLKLMHKNAERLQRLINQILDFRSMESKSLKFEPSWGNVTRFARETAHLFVPLAQQKGLQFVLTDQSNDLNAWFDKDKLEKIIYNLLSNAHKHTQKGKIEFNIQTYNRESLPHKSKKWDSEKYTDFLELTVRDSGEGIPKNKIPHIFDRFYHLQSNNSSVQGTGIGLSLTKELLEIHNGKIFVTSVVNEGSEFKLIIPLSSEKAEKELSTTSEKILEEDENIYLNVVEEEHDQHVPEERLPTILVVEDNEDLREYMRIEFGPKFKMIEADNGEAGLEIALKEIPDLIISDLMMPKMDGIEFCKAIKKDQRTSHIPIIILTAHTSQFNKIRGYEIGADDYITKPFSSELLVLRVENLLKGRKELQSKFSREVRLEPKDLQISSMDERFLTKAMEVVEENLNDSEFNADAFASEMCMSRVHLYRKLKALTDQSVSDFVKTARLKLAANLVGQNKLTIKEAAYTVGFKDPKYFSKCFKQQFGVKPSEYHQEEVEEDKGEETD
jgi:signal transduction histidine kinase/DNA-binding response OmpR family regulator/ligand-binding sensor domain-containing protein